MHQKIVEAAIV